MSAPKIARNPFDTSESSFAESSFAESDFGDPERPLGPPPRQPPLPSFDELMRMTLDEFKRSQDNLFTQLMTVDQGQIALAKKKMENDNLMKQLLLQKNQNPVLNQNPYITQKQDEIRSQRRFIEAEKYQQDEFTRAEQVSTIANEQQYLTQQAYANYNWGIPAVQGIVNGGQEYFADQ